MGFMHQALNTYSKTGSLPDTPFFHRLEARWEANPARFEANHPVLGLLMEDAACPGLLPQEGIFDALRDRYELNPGRFSKYHPFWGKLFDREQDALANCLTCQPPVIPENPVTPPWNPGTENPWTPPCNPHTPAVPEPPAMILMGLGLIGLFLTRRRWSKKIGIGSDAAETRPTVACDPA